MIYALGEKELQIPNLQASPDIRERSSIASKPKGQGGGGVLSQMLTLGRGSQNLGKHADVIVAHSLSIVNENYQNVNWDMKTGAQKGTGIESD